MGIIKTAKNRDEILVQPRSIHCPVCGEEYFSPFDRLFIYAYDECVSCIKDPEAAELLAVIIFALL